MSGRLFVIAAPSGAGKTSLVKAALERESNLRVCVSHTTRPKRPNEIDGRDYHFIDVPTFKTLIDADGFLEYAPVFDNFYGTSRAALAEAFGRGHDVILEIDWQGARQVRERTRDAASGRAGCTTVFVLPPSRAELERRLRGRGTDDATVIARRLRDAVDDMSHYGEFDYLVVNDVFADALSELRAIVISSRMEVFNQSRTHSALIEALIG
ncbi:MAG: guanylate kinase [Gammaproteobacteria bacterium]|nr:guanylate kinase [Gammaproteobacteria bacterium]